jgi:hypothetical protein
MVIWYISPVLVSFSRINLATLMYFAVLVATYYVHFMHRWHLGFCKREYLPTNRGFDTHFGYWNAAEDYYTKYVSRDRFYKTTFRPKTIRINFPHQNLEKFPVVNNLGFQGIIKTCTVIITQVISAETVL